VGDLHIFEKAHRAAVGFFCMLMEMKRLFATLLLLILPFGSCGRSEPVAVMPIPMATTAPVQLAHLTIHVTDLRNHKGQLLLGIYTTADGFPSTAAKAVNWQVKPAAAGDLVFTADLPVGNYSASVLHDENSDGKMNTNFFGIPTEGYGVTNNPKPHRRAARFDEGIFKLPPGGADLSISMQYDFF
jgi:uncharacterized protein (DUF2141 family)